jgi:3-hydroxyacyl-CoA dehydrogenase
MERIDKILRSQVKKGLADADAAARSASIVPVVEFTEFKRVDLTIEAASENIDIKRSIFEDLEKFCRGDAILATNTSSLSITQIGAFTASPQRVVGLHFFNPAHVMKLVEVIPGLSTSEDTVRTCMEFVGSLDKLAVRVEECASFLVNRLLGRYMNESLWCLQEGVAIEEIDRAACDFAMPIGPLALRDMNGADIGLAVAKFNYSEYGERFRPPAVLQAMVDANLLGQKTGKGFYLYDPETRKRTGANPEVEQIARSLGDPGPATAGFSPERLFLPMINEAFLVLQEKVCAAADLDPALRAGLGMRQGPLALAADIGLDKCLKKIEEMFERYGERFRPAPLLKRYVWGGRTVVVP